MTTLYHCFYLELGSSRNCARPTFEECAAPRILRLRLRDMPELEEKYIGLALAVASSLGIGASFILTKKGLNDAADKHGFEGDGFVYLKTPLWWAGIVSLVIGELANFAAYAFAPAILVTPLGALSVLIGAVLGAYFLDEQLGVLGKLGCATCLLGAIIIVLHAPPDQAVETVDEILAFAIQPGTPSLAASFLSLLTLSQVFSSTALSP